MMGTEIEADMTRTENVSTKPQQPVVAATGLAVRRDRGAGRAHLRARGGPAPHGGVESRVPSGGVARRVEPDRPRAPDSSATTKVVPAVS